MHVAACGITEVSYTIMVDSPPKFRAPWRRSEFAIGGYVPYSALSEMEKAVLKLDRLCSGLATPDLRFL